VQIPLWMAYILIYSNYADFAIPGPFITRVQNALKAEPTSVKLAGLVGAGGLWYGFGRMLLSLYVNQLRLHNRSGSIISTSQIRRPTRRLNVRAAREGGRHSHKQSPIRLTDDCLT